MKSNYFKYLFGLVLILGLFLTSCTNTTDPLSDDTGAQTINKIDYKPSVEDAQVQAEGLLVESFKTIIEGSTISKNASSLGKSNGGSTYFYIDGWHTWRGELDASPFDIEDSYNAEYLGKIQFQNGQGPIPLPEEANKMLVYLNAHVALGFVGDDPSGDERWYDFQGMITPLTGNPSSINAGGEYERRWVGLYSSDGENWVLTELHNKYNVIINDLKFYYDWDADDYYLYGNVNIVANGLNIMVRFNNSRTALMEIYQNGTLVSTSQLELPNFYQMMNIPSLNNWNFGSSFNFPLGILF